MLTNQSTLKDRAMEKIRYSIVLLLALVTFSCKQREEKKIIPVNMSDTIVTEKDRQANAEKPTDDTIHLGFIDEKGIFTTGGTIDSLHPRIYLNFETDDLGKLKASVKPAGGKGNIRFNQIIFPDKTADGPFGTELNLELKQTGKHTLIIGHSLMADNPFWGKFEVKLQINGE